MGNLGIQNIDDSGLVPTEYAEEIIKEVKGESVLLTHGKKTPVLTSKTDLSNASLTASQLDVIVPIRKSLLEDSSYDIYSDIVEEGTRKLGMAYDNAGLFGVGKPPTWSESVYELATRVGNNIALNKNTNMAVTIHDLETKIGTQGFSVDGFVVPNGACWYLRELRDSFEQPIYSLDLRNKYSGLLYGFPVSEFSFSNFEAKKVKMVMADWSKILVGVMSDVHVEKLDQAVVSDATGKVVYNLVQADAVAFKLTIHLGFAIDNPVISSQEDASKCAPVGIITGD